MSKYRDAILTDKGLDFVRNAVNGVIQIQFTKGVMSAEDHSKDSDQAIQGLTSLNGFVDSDPINYTLPVDEENVAVPLRFRNVSMTENNYIDTIGIYATDGKNEILYSVIINDDPELFSAYNGKTPESVKINSTTQVGRAEQVTTQVSPLGMVTEEEFHNVINNWNGDDKDHNFTAKLQHNGVDVVDSNELNQAISNFSGDNKNHNFTADLQYKGVEVATQNDIANVLNTKRGDFVEGRSFNELIGQSGVYDINNHNLANYKDNQGLPTDAGDIYGAVIPFAGTGFTTIFVFMANGRTFVAPRSQYVNTPFKELASIDQVNAKFGDAYNRAVADAEQYADNHHILAMPTQSLKPGDSFDSYTNAGHYNINGLNPIEDLSSGLGLPNAPMWTDLLVIPNANAITQEINDNIGNRWSRVVGKAWTNFVNANLGFYDSISIKNINLINPDTNKFTFNNAYLTYDPNKKIATLHGSIQANTNVNVDDNVFTFEIDNLSKNEVISDYLGQDVYAAFNIQTDNSLKNVIAPSNFAKSSGYVWNLEGTTITLGYNSQLIPKYPNGVPNNSILIPDGSNLNNYTTIDPTVTYFALPNTNLVNGPNIPAGFIMKVVADHNGIAQNVKDYNSVQREARIYTNFNTNWSQWFSTNNGYDITW